MIFLDTDICIDILHGKYSLSSFIETFSSQEKFGITSLSVFELFIGFYKLRFGKNKIIEKNLNIERKSIEKLIQGLYIFPLNEKAAKLAAKIFRKIEATGKSLDPFDCLIASIILSNDYCNILTRNIKLFQRIDGIKPIKP
ncbi:MAG: putative Ribonuclease VapC [Promethearchaeota archaeon]|nr:MAG: putative Ribonuclease VapC [Candidatus Lokiarchaeota archaeon]